MSRNDGADGTAADAFAPDAQYTPLLASPRTWVDQLQVPPHSSELFKNQRLALVKNQPAEHARVAYLRMLATILSGYAFHCGVSNRQSAHGADKRYFDECRMRTQLGTHQNKNQLSPYAVSMAGIVRMWSMADLVERVSHEGLNGSYAETGVWEGGMSIFTTAAMQLHGLEARPVYVCDSFFGLPKPRSTSLRPDEKVYFYQKYLRAEARQVLANFQRFGVPHKQVVPVPGFFKDSMPGFSNALAGRGEVLALLRLDGDMYDSTVDVLYNLYERVEVGGYVIIDDFGWTPNPSFGARDAVLDFRALHGIEDASHTMHPIDKNGAWFQKTRQVSVRRELYLRSLNVTDVGRGGQKLLRPAGFFSNNKTVMMRLLSKWEAALPRTEFKTWQMRSELKVDESA